MKTIILSKFKLSNVISLFRNICIFVLLICPITTSASDKGHHIEIQINGLRLDTIFFGYHYGTKQLVSDTLLLDANGFSFVSDEEELAAGIYFIVVPGNQYFELLIGEDQFFSIETDVVDYIVNMKVTGSKENEVFCDYQRFMQINTEQAKQLRTAIQSKTYPQDSVFVLQKKLKALTNEVTAKYAEIESKNKGTAIGTIVGALQDVSIPDPPRDEKGKQLDSLFTYKYYKSHYFDHIDFSDSSLIRTPFFEQKIDYYFDKLIIAHKDSMIVEVDRLIQKSKANYGMYQFMTNHLANYFEICKMMGMDAVFVHIAEKYVLSGTTAWADSLYISKFIDRVTHIKPNLIGNYAPELLLMSASGKRESLKAINARCLAVIFWEPGCNHCRQVIGELQKIYNDYHDKGFEVYAVYSLLDTALWKKYIHVEKLQWINVYDPEQSSGFPIYYDVHSTPLLYILDNEKRIMYKRLDVNYLRNILEKLFR